MNGVKNKLEAVNALSTIHSRIINVLDKAVQRFDVLASGHILSVAGCEIPVDTAKEDEGVWLEKRTHKGYVRVTKGRVTGQEADFLEVVFDEAIQSGMYVLAIYTRCGHGEGYRVVRVSRKVRAL